MIGWLAGWLVGWFVRRLLVLNLLVIIIIVLAVGGSGDGGGGAAAAAAPPLVAAASCALAGAGGSGSDDCIGCSRGGDRSQPKLLLQLLLLCYDEASSNSRRLHGALCSAPMPSTRRMKLPRFQPKLADFGISCQLQNTWARRNTQIGSCGDPGTVFGVAMSRVHWGYNPEPCFLSLEVHCQIQDPETLKHGFQNYRQSISPDPMSMLGATSSASRGLILPAELQSWHPS